MASNKLTPAYEGIELGIGETIIIKAILEATGRTRKALDEDYKNMGDLGLVAQARYKEDNDCGFLSESKYF